MPKPFMLGVEVEEIALGKVMRQLNNMPGVVKLHMDLKTKAAKPNGEYTRGPYKPRKVYAKTGEEVALEYLAKKPGTNAQIREQFIVEHRSPHSINSVLHTLKNDGLIKADDAGVYSLTKKMKDRLRHRKDKK